MKIAPILALLATTNAALAQDLLSADEFDQLSVGTTLYFSEDGRHYGSEQFLENRQSVWRAEDGSCVNGRWAEIEGGICFLYDGSDTTHCWVLIREDGIITITSMTPAEGELPTQLEVTSQDTIPIICTGPTVGV